MQKILIVDDDPDVLDTLKSILTSRNFEVDTVSNHNNICENIKKFHPSVILMDVNLNGVDGRVICKGLKNDQTTMDIPIILFSGDSSIKNNYKEFLAQDFIEKPVKIQSLVQKLKGYSI